MKYASTFFTILLIWVAVILMSLTISNSNQVFELYVAVMISTLLLFLIGFGRA
jgi:hypothetical protein